jgi:hypothetical protein
LERENRFHGFSVFGGHFLDRIDHEGLDLDLSGLQIQAQVFDGGEDRWRCAEVAGRTHELTHPRKRVKRTSDLEMKGGSSSFGFNMRDPVANRFLNMAATSCLFDTLGGRATMSYNLSCIQDGPFMSDGNMPYALAKMLWRLAENRSRLVPSSSGGAFVIGEIMFDGSAPPALPAAPSIDTETPPASEPEQNPFVPILDLSGVGDLYGDPEAAR